MYKWLVANERYYFHPLLQQLEVCFRSFFFSLHKNPYLTRKTRSDLWFSQLGTARTRPDEPTAYPHQPFVSRVRNNGRGGFLLKAHLLPPWFHTQCRCSSQTKRGMLTVFPPKRNEERKTFTFWKKKILKLYGLVRVKSNDWTRGQESTGSARSPTKDQVLTVQHQSTTYDCSWEPKLNESQLCS